MREHDVSSIGKDRSGEFREENSLARFNNHLPPENIFGHTKKLQYILRHLEKIVQRNPQARILDFGCGNGAAVSRYLIAALPDNSSYFGVDIHSDSVAHANANFGKRNAVFFDEIPDGAFDAVVYADVLEHLDRPVETLSAHQKLLKPGGEILGSIPNGIGPFEIESAIDRRFKLSQRIASLMQRTRGKDLNSIPYNSDSGHLQFYRKNEFVGILSRSGFETVEFKNGTFFGAMVTERFLRYGGQPLMRANTAIAEVLPHWAVSTWLFRARRI